MKTRTSSLSSVLPVFLVSCLMGGCITAQANDQKVSKPAGDQTIRLISREDGSGTRTAFSDLFHITKDGKDFTAPDSQVTNSTAVMMESIQQDPNAIGYVSMGSLNDEFKALSINGIAPSIESVNDGSYPISRSFLIVTNDTQQNELAKDFEAYLLSDSGQKIVTDCGYVPIRQPETYFSSGLDGNLTIGGSSSVCPLMEKLAESYQELNPQSEISVMQTDSSTGISSTIEGVYDIGMSSRPLVEEEKKQGLKSTEIARDGIVVVVNLRNPVNSLTLDQVKQIYTKAIPTWNELIDQ